MNVGGVNDVLKKPVASTFIAGVGCVGVHTYSDMKTERRNSGARGTAVAREWLCKQVLLSKDMRTQQWKSCWSQCFLWFPPGD
jgi:hypothetical protein